MKSRSYILNCSQKKDQEILELIKSYFGNISKQGKDCLQYRVSSIKDIITIISYFEKDPLITQKRTDF